MKEFIENNGLYYVACKVYNYNVIEKEEIT